MPTRKKYPKEFKLDATPTTATIGPALSSVTMTVLPQALPMVQTIMLVPVHECGSELDSIHVPGCKCLSVAN
jgi:hypothetical protein